MVAGAQDVSERVIELVAQQTGRARAAITPETEIERDLGCTASEIRDLMVRLEMDLGIDMTGFDFDRHFDEPGSLLWPIGVSLVVALPVTVMLTPLVGLLLGAAGVDAARLAAGRGPFLLVYLSCVLLIGVVTILLPRLRTRRCEKIPVTVQTLIEAALLRRWPAQKVEGVSR